MEHIIRFGKMLDLLTAEEFITFINSQLQNQLKNIFIKSFLFQFVTMKNPSQFENTVINIEQMICQINDLIHLRKENKKSQESQFKCKQLDALPLPLISNISSFLNLIELLSFELVNKSIIIGTRTPIVPQTMNSFTFQRCLSFSNDYKCIYNWYRFKDIQMIQIPLQTIFNEYYTDEDGDVNSLKGRDITLFRRLPIFYNIKQLALISDDSKGEYYSRWLFGNLLKKQNIFSSLKYLSTEDSDTTQNLIHLLPQLHGYGVEADCLERKIAETFCIDKFKSFHGGCTDIDLLKQYSEIQEMCLLLFDYLVLHFFVHLREILLFYDYWPKLKRICIRLDKPPIKPLPPNYPYIFLGYVECLEIKCGNHDILKFMLNLLVKVHVFNDTMNIKIRISSCGDFIDEEIVDLIYRFINQLYKEFHHFMLSLLIKDVNNSLLDIQNNNDYLVNSDDTNGYCYISNNECLLSGYRDKWLMRCCKCER